MIVVEILLPCYWNMDCMLNLHGIIDPRCRWRSTFDMNSVKPSEGLFKESKALCHFVSLDNSLYHFYIKFAMF